MNEEYETLMMFHILTAVSGQIDEAKIKYAAVDADGSLWCYDTEPNCDYISFWGISAATDLTITGGGRVCTLKPCEFWKDTLIKL